MMSFKLSTDSRPTRRRNGSVLALAFALVCSLGAGLVGVRGLMASENPMASGGTGGDTVGSLPLHLSAPEAGGEKTAIGSGQIAGPERPAFALTGMEGDILAAIVDAYATGPDGSFAKIPLANGRVRYEFYGRMTVILKRSNMLSGLVRGQTVVGYSFAGGVGTVSVGGLPRATEALVMGVRDLQIPALDSAGILSQGLSWHAVSLANSHRIVHLKNVGNTIRVDQRD